jgi:hypothetical protein
MDKCAPQVPEHPRRHGLDANKPRPESIQTEERIRRVKFQRLVLRWRADCALESSASRIISHPAYLKIIEMGTFVVPLILAEIRDGGRHWSFALRMITGFSPVTASDSGNMARQSERWLEWGRLRGLI